MDEVKLGIASIIFGNLLYLLYISLTKIKTTAFGDLCKGVLLGISVAINMIGVVIIIIYVVKNDKTNKKKG